MTAGARSPSERTTARTVVRDGRERLFFGGSSYLGLAHHPEVVAAATRALGTYGVSAGAARDTSGTTVEHLALEAELATFADAEDCALVPDAALGDLALALARLRPGADVWTDVAAHPSVRDAIAASGARARLGGAPSVCSAAFSDGTFPSAGRVADLAALLATDLELIAIDDAHGFGLLGERGAGAAEALQLRTERCALVVSLSKALGTYGGAVLGSRATIDAVRATSPYACTTAPPPAIVAAARVALRILQSEPERRTRCLANAARLQALVDSVAPTPRELVFPVRALALEDAEHTRAVHLLLLEQDIDVPLVTYVGGPAAAYLRFAVTAEHRDQDLDRLEVALRRAHARGARS